MKRLYRSEENKILAGICGGIGEYFDIDPVIVRVVVVIVAILTAILPTLLVYILLIFIIPKRGENRSYVEIIRDDSEDKSA